MTNTYIDPKDRKLTVDAWCDLWIESYAKRDSTVRQAKVHLAQIREEFGPLPLMAVDEMAVKRVDGPPAPRGRGAVASLRPA
ncbi:hypothetical protein [Streptomyces sp. KL116D]|uniref:hypothetical protein n=1 Tax=Streptomyces sp. KL116D TaxID=3045152 RepID=UPI003557BBAA